MDEKRSPSLSAESESDVAVACFPQDAQVAARHSVLDQWFSKIWRGKWTLLTSIAIFLLLALMIGAIRSSLYRTQTTIEVRNPEPFYPPASAESGAQVSAPRDSSYLDTQLRIIQSRSVVELVLEKLDDSERSRLLEAPRFWWSANSYDQKLQSILAGLTAKPSQQAGFIDISFLSPDPVSGARFLNLLSQELEDLNVERAWRASERNREWTDRQLEQLRRRWEQSEQVLAEYSQASGLVATVAPRSLYPAGPTTDAKLRQLKLRLGSLQKQIVQWQSLYGAVSPNVLSLEQDRSKMEAAIRQRQVFLSKSPSPAPQVSPPVSQEPSSANQAQAIVHLNILKQDAASNQRIYETTTARLKEADVASASRIADISVIDPAIPVTEPATPSQFLNGAMGVVVGLLFGITYLLLRDRLSSTFAEPDLLRQYLGLPVLGAIPHNRLDDAEQFRPPNDPQPELYASFDTDPRTAEAYRSIRSSILLKIDPKTGPKHLVFTSALASEGKTSVVFNLGAALASAQRRVLLVDGDLRNPALHKIFGTDNEHGLTDLLSRQITESPIASRDVVRQTPIPDLYLLPAGQAGSRAPEILASLHLPHLVREFAKAFDIVLIDAPAILPCADARTLARAADAVILIVKAGVTDRRSASLARETISQDGANIMGVILTDWQSTQSATV
jgi:succinoglycan biosynthesis transport protein ExoP